jgi:hypothetical protein
MSDPTEDRIRADAQAWQRTRSAPPSLDRAMNVILHRRRTPQRWLLVAACVAVVASAALVPTALRSHHSPHQVAAATRSPAASALSCPSSFTASSPGAVPASGGSVDAANRMVPQQAVRSAVVCSYGVSSALAGSHPVTGNLAGLTETLTWLPELTGNGSTMGAVAASTNYLVGLSYQGGTLWVASTDISTSAVHTSNGVFSSPANLSPQFASLYASGTWPASTPTSATSCDPAGFGRLGQESSLVPAGASSVSICSGTPGQLSTPVQRSVRDSSVGALMSQLGRLSTGGPTLVSCTTGQPATQYQLAFHYSNGPAVSVTVDPGCSPYVRNGSLSSSSPVAAVTALLATLAK